MATPTTNLLLEKLVNGENPGTWDEDIRNAFDMLDSAIAGAALISTTGGDTTLTDANYTNDEAKAAVLDIDGVLVSNANIIVPARDKIYGVKNGTSGAYSVTIKTATGTGVVIPQGASAFVRVSAFDNEVEFLTPPTDSDLNVIAGLTPSNDDIIQRKAGAWTNRTMAQLAADLGGTGVFQPLDADLTSWALLTRASGFDTFTTTPSVANLMSLLTDDATGLGTFMVTPSSANLASLVTDETGSGSLVFGTSPSLTTSALLSDGFVINWNAGDVTLTHSLNTLTLAGGSLVLPSAGLTVGASIPFSDSAGTLTLQNVDALDATTEATIESAIDTLANLTSIQGRTVTLADAGANALFGWDDAAGAYENLSAAEATAVLNAFVGDSGSGGTKGLVPAPVAGDATKFLRGDGTFVAIPGGGDALTSNPLSQFAATTSAQLAGVISDETGTGALVFATSPTLVTPLLGTPTSGTLTNCTGLPVSSGISGLGTGVATALAVNVGTAGAPVVNGGALGTPSSGTLTNATGYPFTSLAGTLTSAQLAAYVSDETGSGALMFGTSPSITTDIRPASNDGASLGTAALGFSDAFFASGAVINFNAGDVTITHSADTLAIEGGNVGIGTTSANNSLTVYRTSSNALARFTSDGVGCQIDMERYDGTANGTFSRFIKARGSVASPSAVTSGDQIAIQQFRAYGGTNFRTVGSIASHVETYTSDTDISCYLTFATSPPGSVTATEKMRITGAGNVKIGGTANRGTTEGTNQIVLFDGTAPVGTLTNGVSFYSASGEARVMDAAGNSTLLSPHDRDTNEWIYWSKNTNTGQVLRIDMERLMRRLDAYFGGGFIREFTEGLN